jgi:hypothetical protein
MVGEVELAWMLIYSGFLAIPGVMKLMEVINQTYMIGNGYIQVKLLMLNRRMKTFFVKPKERQVKLRGKTYDYDDHPDYMVYESGFFKAIPTIAIDEKSSTQIKLCNTNTLGSNPTIIHGAGKISYNQGYIDASSDFKKFSNYFLIIILLCIGAIATSLIGAFGIGH